MKVLVVGTGNIGIMSAYILAKQGYDVGVVDTNVDSIHKFVGVIADRDSIKITIFASKFEDLDFDGMSPEIVFSCAPFHTNEAIFDICADRQITYCDLGGDPTTSNNIRKKNLKSKVTCMTDLGLAPGYINILAEYLATDNTQTLDVIVGGIPSVEPDTALKYGLTWSLEGLYNEYKDSCNILLGGQLTTGVALGGHELIEIGNRKLEIFNTKGGISDSLNRLMEAGVLNCRYKTIRYRGHRDIIRYLIQDCEMEYDEFKSVIERSCSYIKDDVVIIQIRRNGNVCYEREIIPYDGWSAMQIATACPAVAVVMMICENETPKRRTLSYPDIDMDIFDEYCRDLSDFGFDGGGV